MFYWIYWSMRRRIENGFWVAYQDLCGNGVMEWRNGNNDIEGIVWTKFMQMTKMLVLSSMFVVELSLITRHTRLRFVWPTLMCCYISLIRDQDLANLWLVMHSKRKTELIREYNYVFNRVRKQRMSLCIILLKDGIILNRFGI